MQSITLILLLFTTSLFAQVPAKMRPMTFNEGVYRSDLERILVEAKLPPETVQVRFRTSLTNDVDIVCAKNQFHLEVAATEEEKGATFYKGLRELGFLFPHPVRQISPTIEKMREACGKNFLWRPTLKYRGFHLHTLHPSEWTHAFLMGRNDIAMQTIRWLARNGQNIFDVILLRQPLAEIEKNLVPLFHYAQSFGIHTGVSIGIATQQQKTYRLLTLWESLWDSSDAILISELEKLTAKIPLSYLTLEKGSSEFTPTNYERTIRWLNLAAETLEKKNIALFTKVHVSSNQVDKKYGNFNFIPKFAKSNVGIWPHTVFFYGLLDRSAPIYGNKTFDHMRDYMLQEKDKRPVWYYPETGYWIGLDQDIPLLLTEYLRTRAEDFAWLSQEGFEGHINFTTGHALGGWFYDWNLALITDGDYTFSPMAAPLLLGEDIGLWRRHMFFQQRWFKERQIIPMLTSANLQDELSSHRIHDRYTMRELSGDHDQVKKELELLQGAWREWPPIDGILDPELKAVMTITKLRHEFAIHLRKSFIENKDENIKKAEDIRLKAKGMIAELEKLPTNYPGLPIFKKHANPTSYQFGYVYLAASTYFWEREERQVKADSLFEYWPFKENIIDWWEILF